MQIMLFLSCLMEGRSGSPDRTSAVLVARHSRLALTPWIIRVLLRPIGIFGELFRCPGRMHPWESTDEQLFSRSPGACQETGVHGSRCAGTRAGDRCQRGDLQPGERIFAEAAGDS